MNRRRRTPILRYTPWLQTWEASGKRLLDDIGVGRGWICADIGYGGQSIILTLLHERTGQEGFVTGVEPNAEAAARAEQFCTSSGLHSMRMLCDDVTYLSLPRTYLSLPRDVFDLVVVQAWGRKPLAAQPHAIRAYA